MSHNNMVPLEYQQTYGGKAYEALANMSLNGHYPDLQHLDSTNFEEMAVPQDESPNSSNGSSPRPQLHGNRARALSLNTRGSHSRSTAHMTQQQINKKRQRATPEQLIVLEEAFVMNPSPNAKMRELISSQISMTERSVQIWFQNRRAKTKLLNKRGTFDDLGFQQAPYGLRPGLPARSFSIDQSPLEEYRFQGPSQQSASTEADFTRFSCRSLTIGTWRRVACTSNDLICYFSKTEPKFTHYINSGASGFKIEFAIASVAKFDLRYAQQNDLKELGRATITLSRAPLFFIETPAGGWKQCIDFTENVQATTVFAHAMVGPYQHLKRSFTDLASTYKETIGLMTFEDLETAPIPEQLAPPLAFEQNYPAIATRTSQSAGFTTPDGQALRRNPTNALFMDNSNMSSRGSHRRTRSRSAPMTVDFSQIVNQSNVGGMPGYSFGQQSIRIDPNYRPNTDLTPSSSTTGAYDYGDSLYTPTASGTPNYQEPWYMPSYANTPLLDAERSQLGSPMIPAPAQFDLSAGTLPPESFSAGYPLLAQGVGAATMPHLVNANHSMPELPRLDRVAEIPATGQSQFSSLQNLAQNQLSAALDPSQMDFSDMPPAQPHGGPDFLMVDRN